MFMLSFFKLLNELMPFPRLGAAFYSKTTYECTQSQMYEVHDAWFVDPQ
jgi:hypothetical protein